MTVDVKWHYALAIAAQEFDAVERQSGWQESMKLSQLAALQHPWVKGDPVSNRRRQAFFWAIHQACTSGELANESRELTLYKTELKHGRRIRSTGIGGHVIEPTTFNERVPYQAHVPFVTAAAFADWLRKQGEEPSEHISHWFKVRKVASGAQLLELTTPDADAPQDATNDRWWFDWCTKRIAANTLPDGSTKRGRAREGWTDGDLNVLGLRFSTLKERELSDSAAKTSIAFDLKTSVQALRVPLEKWAALQMQSNNQPEQKAN